MRLYRCSSGRLTWHYRPLNIQGTMTRRCAPRSGAEPNGLRRAGLTEMKRLGVAALQLMLAYDN